MRNSKQNKIKSKLFKNGKVDQFVKKSVENLLWLIDAIANIKGHVLLMFRVKQYVFQLITV